MEKLLTIAIPTYNRKEYIKECLESIYASEDVDFSLIDVLVSDNSTNEETKQYVEEFYPDINFIFNGRNIDSDMNFLQCLKKAKGKYIQILSDDDILEKNCLKNLLSTLDNNQFCLGFLNNCGFDLSIDNISTAKKLNLKMEKVIFEGHDKSDFLFLIKQMFSFISIIIFNKEIVDNITNPERFCNTNFLQDYIAVESLKSNLPVFIDGKSIVYNRCLNSGSGYNFYEVFIRRWKQLIQYSIGIGVIDKKKSNKYFNICLKETVAYTIYQKKINNNSPYVLKNFNKYLRYIWNYSNTWKKIIPTLLCPKWILKLRSSRKRG